MWGHSGLQIWSSPKAEDIKVSKSQSAESTYVYNNEMGVTEIEGSI